MSFRRSKRSSPGLPKRSGKPPGRASLVGLLQQLFPTTNRNINDSNTSISTALAGSNADTTEAQSITSTEIKECIGRDSISVAKQRRQAKRRKSAEELTKSILSSIEVDVDLTNSQRNKATTNLMSAILCIDDEDLTDDEFSVASGSNLGGFLERDSVSVANQRGNRQVARDIRQAIAELTSSIVSIDTIDTNALDLLGDESAGDEVGAAMQRDSISVAQERRRRRRSQRRTSANNLAASLIKILDVDESVLTNEQRRKSGANLQSAIMKLDPGTLEEIEDDSEEDNDVEMREGSE